MPLHDDSPVVGRPDEPFTIDAARKNGVTGPELYSGGLHIPTQGVRTVEGPSSLLLRARAFALVLPRDATFSHQTAAELLGVPIPKALRDNDIHVTTPGRRAVLRRDSAIGHRGGERKRAVTALGLPVTSAEDVLVDLAPRVSVDSLVQIGDAMLIRDPDFVMRARSVLSRRKGAHGLPKVRLAIDEMRRGSWSPMESQSRLLMQRWNLPEPRLNYDVSDDYGNWLACVDFCWPEQRVIVEYDGALHADREQRERDIHRRARLSAAGWTVIVITAKDVVGRRHPWISDLRDLLCA